MSDGKERFQTTEEYQEEKDKGTESKEVQKEIDFDNPESQRGGFG